MVNVIRELAKAYTLVVLCYRIGSWVYISLAPEVVLSLKCKLYCRITHIEHIGLQICHLAFSISLKKINGCQHVSSLALLSIFCNHTHRLPHSPQAPVRAQLDFQLVGLLCHKWTCQDRHLTPKERNKTPMSSV